MFSKLGNYEDNFLLDQDSCCLFFLINQIFVKLNSDKWNKVKPVSVVEGFSQLVFNENLGQPDIY